MVKKTDPRRAWPRTIKKEPIKELSREEQYNKLPQWIKDIYGTANLSQTPPPYKEPLPNNSPYNRTDHVPFSDWSAKHNYRYYGNLLNLEVDWGETRGIKHVPFVPPYSRPQPTGQTTWKPTPSPIKPTHYDFDFEAYRSSAYEASLRQQLLNKKEEEEFWKGLGGYFDEDETPPITKPKTFAGLWGILNQLKTLKEKYWGWNDREVLVRWAEIKTRLSQLKQRVPVGHYYHTTLREAEAKIQAIQQSFNYMMTRDRGWWILMFIIFLLCSAIATMSNYERLTTSRTPSLDYCPNPEVKKGLEVNYGWKPDLPPVEEPGSYDFKNPPTFDLPEFVNTPPPIEDLLIKPNKEMIIHPSFIKPTKKEADLTITPTISASSFYYNPIFTYYPELEIEPNQPDQEIKDLVVVPSKDLAVRVNWQDFLPPMSFPGDKPLGLHLRTFFQVYKELFVSLLTYFFGITILPWVGRVPVNTIQEVKMTPKLERVNNFLETHYLNEEQFDKQPLPMREELMEELNIRVRFLELINELLFPITESEWFSLAFKQKQNILNRINTDFEVGFPIKPS